MEGFEVGLEKMLSCRERRARLQEELAAEYGCPLISFTMNIPGPIKTNSSIKSAFIEGKNELLKALGERHVAILRMEQFNEDTGDELLLAVAPAGYADGMPHMEPCPARISGEFETPALDAGKIPAGFAAEIKALTTNIEETHPFGRLFDMDVITPEGRKLSRPVFRKCLICGRQAQECARSRAHSVKEMQDKVEEILSLLP